MTREAIQNQLKVLTQKTSDAEVVRIAMAQWLGKKECTDFEINQILNDLTGYKEYLAILN